MMEWPRRSYSESDPTVPIDVDTEEHEGCKVMLKSETNSILKGSNIPVVLEAFY